MTNGLAYYNIVFITAVPAFITQALQSTEVFETVFLMKKQKNLERDKNIC